ncbi:MAG: hypothetical protein LBT09_15280 [Planctomycetaceae bacterium]|nr:hypothetical protein [Planctomycetaceae bacterium]
MDRINITFIIDKSNKKSFLPVRAFISIEIIAIEIKLVRRTLTKCRLKPYGLNCRAGNIFSIDVEALKGKDNSENNTDRINITFRIDKLDSLFSCEYFLIFLTIAWAWGVLV